MRNFNKYIVNNDNIKFNITLIKRLLKDNVKLCAVVKANAYGIGVENVCKTIDEVVDFYAVSNVDEAKQIRDLGYSTNILILGIVPIDDIEYCANNNVAIQISSFSYLKAINEHLHSNIKIHLKVNSGLNRYGFKDKTELDKVIKFISKNPNLILEGIFTHFATKGSDLEYINIQKNVFDEFCKLVPKNCIKHCANSFATLYSSTLQMDMVRIGANMYGDIRNEKLPLKDVLSIESEVVFINKVKKGQSVGYDRTFIAQRNSTIAVVPLGYADGINRKLSNKFSVLINDKFAKIVGNICMDCFMIDVTDIKDVYVGSEVVILGKYYKNEISIKNFADTLHTSPYDVLLNFRNQRMKYVSITNSCEKL